MLERCMEFINSFSALLIGFIGSVAIAGSALMKRALTRSGAAAAIVMGTIYYGSGDLVWFGLVLVFFISSTFWSKWKQQKKRHLDAVYEKTGERDAGQVFANGGVGMVLCVLHAIWPNSLWLWMYVGVMATVNADTWATEIGSLSRALPRSLLSGKRVPVGTSGAVSLLGTAASAAGALTIGVAAAAGLMLFRDVPAGITMEYNGTALIILAVGATIGGVCGAIFDSLLGATVQAGYRCKECGSYTERLIHCAADTIRVRGFAWLNNDGVNLIASCGGGAVSMLLIDLLLGLC